MNEHSASIPSSERNNPRVTGDCSKLGLRAGIEEWDRGLSTDGSNHPWTFGIIFGPASAIDYVLQNAEGIVSLGLS